MLGKKTLTRVGSREKENSHEERKQRKRKLSRGLAAEKTKTLTRGGSRENENSPEGRKQRKMKTLTRGGSRENENTPEGQMLLGSVCM